MTRRFLFVLLWIPFAAAAQQARTINLNATANPWQFTPASFTVNQGDIVTLEISVPPADASLDGHGFLMDTYVQNGVSLPRGQTRKVSFTATTAGTFAFVCTVASCGIGHSSMFGQMIVNAVTALSISSITPATGPTSGGINLQVTGEGFQPNATLMIGGRIAPIITMASTAIFARLPPGPANEPVALPVDVTVTNPDGTTATKSRAFTYFVPDLAVTSIVPVSGSAGTVVTITGAGFTSAVSSSVKFGDVDATEVRVVDAVTMTAIAPAHVAGVVDVIVRAGANSVTKARGFTYVDARRRAVRH